MKQLYSKITGYILALILVVPMLSSCSGDDQFEKLEFSIAPPRPVVVDADTTKFIDVDGDGFFNENAGDEKVAITGPWILVQPSITNNLDTTITVVSIKFDIVGEENGFIKETSITLDPSELRTGTAESLVLGELAPGASLIPNKWFLHSLPNSSGFSYSITAEILGWVGSFNADAEARIIKRYVFTTQ